MLGLFSFKVISIFFILTSVSWIELVSSQVFFLAKQYYECKYLTMIKETGMFGEESYIPDLNIEGNTLDDLFYQTLGFETMNFDQAMDLFQQIYQETENCDSEFCECVRLREGNYDGRSYAVFFQDENLSFVKNIISSLDQALSSDRFTFENMTYYWGFGSGQNLPTLSKFCFENEYTSYRAVEYFSYTLCLNSNNIKQELLSCEFTSKIDLEKREVITNPTNEQLENRLICELLNAKDCAIEKQRFEAIAKWSLKFPTLEWSGSSMVSYFDKLIERASSYEAEIKYDSVNVVLDGNYFYVKSFKNGSQIGLVVPDGSFICLNSEKLYVLCETGFNQDNKRYISKMTVSADDGNGITTFLVDEPFISEINNGTIIINEQGENIFQVFVTKWPGFLNIYDFNSNSLVSYYKHGLSVTSPVYLFENSSGLLINGQLTEK